MQKNARTITLRIVSIAAMALLVSLTTACWPFPSSSSPGTQTSPTSAAIATTSCRRLPRQHQLLPWIDMVCQRACHYQEMPSSIRKLYPRFSVSDPSVYQKLQRVASLFRGAKHGSGRLPVMPPLCRNSTRTTCQARVGLPPMSIMDARESTSCYLAAREPAHQFYLLRSAPKSRWRTLRVIPLRLSLHLQQALSWL